MRKYLVIGNPIEHSLSPELHNYWIKNNNINANYEKKKLDEKELKNVILEVKRKNIHGVNVTVPFKNVIISYLDQLSPEAEKTQSVNTIYLSGEKVIGHNTDINGFKLGIENTKFNTIGKRILILGAGGVVPSIIYALKEMMVSKITISNRTRIKAEKLRKLFKDIEVIDWGDLDNFDMIINATSVGIKKQDKINIDFSKVGKNKFFYDLIYNPKETNFLKIGRKLGNKSQNGKMMFVYQALEAFEIWHGVKPIINNGVIKILD
jgi:shikimate dehydrogenase